MSVEKGVVSNSIITDAINNPSANPPKSSFTAAMDEYWLDIDYGVDSSVDPGDHILVSNFTQESLNNGWVAGDTIINAEAFNQAVSTINEERYGAGEYGSSPPGGNGLLGNVTVSSGQTLTLPVNIVHQFRNLILSDNSIIVPSSKNPSDKLIILVKETFTAGNNSSINFNGVGGVDGVDGVNGAPPRAAINGVNGSPGTPSTGNTDPGRGGDGGGRVNAAGAGGSARQAGNAGTFSVDGNIRIGSGGGGGGENCNIGPGQGGVNSPTTWTPQVGANGVNGVDGSNAVRVSQNLGTNDSRKQYFNMLSLTSPSPLNGVDATDGTDGTNGQHGRGGNGGRGGSSECNVYNWDASGGGGGGGEGGWGGAGGKKGTGGKGGISGKSGGIVYIEATNINISSGFQILANGGFGGIGGIKGLGNLGGAAGSGGSPGAGGGSAGPVPDGLPGSPGAPAAKGGDGRDGGMGGNGANGNGGLIILKYHKIVGGASHDIINGNLKVNGGSNPDLEIRNPGSNISYSGYTYLEYRK